MMVSWFSVVCIGLVAFVQLSEGLLRHRQRHQTPDVAAYRAIAALHAIRRRFEISRLKVEVKREATDARHSLAAELDLLDRHEDRS